MFRNDEGSACLFLEYGVSANVSLDSAGGDLRIENSQTFQRKKYQQSVLFHSGNADLEEYM